MATVTALIDDEHDEDLMGGNSILPEEQSFLMRENKSFA